MLKVFFILKKKGMLHFRKEALFFVVVEFLKYVCR